MSILRTTLAVLAISIMAVSCENKTVENTDSVKENPTMAKQDLGKPSEVTADAGAFKIIPLTYEYDALGDNIDAETMKIHFSKHYVGYLNKLNKEVEGKPQASMKIEDVLKNLDPKNATLRNNAGGYFNHNLYFDILSPNGGGEPTGELLEAIKQAFGSFEEFKKKFSDAGSNQFGSGWAWLVSDQSGKLSVGSTANQDNPLMPGMAISGTPILAMDVWEHAYYLKYQNKRADYINNFWNVVNWNKVSEYYTKAKQ